MKRFFGLLVKFVVLVGLVVLVYSFLPTPVQAACSFDAYGACVGTCTCPVGYTGSCSCASVYGYCLADQGVCTPVPPDEPCPDGYNDYCTGYYSANCTSPSFQVCKTYGEPQCKREWVCTASDPDNLCTSWSNWSPTTCYAPDIQTRYCTSGLDIGQAQTCPVGGGGPTATPIPPTPTSTPTPTNTPTPTPTPTPTQAPGPWIKLKDTSFISKNSLVSQIPYTPVAYDADDNDLNPYFTIGSSGLVTASSINLGTNTLAKSGNPEYQAVNAVTAYSMTPSLFYSYVKARKEYIKINSLNEIVADGIYYYQGVNPLSINSAPSEFNSYKVVLISSGTVNINTNLNGINLKSIAILADTINFASTVAEANGIFVADTITTGSNNALGLKIKGNLIAQSVFTRLREWATTARLSSRAANPSIRVILCVTSQIRRCYLNQAPPVRF